MRRPLLALLGLGLSSFAQPSVGEAGTAMSPSVAVHRCTLSARFTVVTRDGSRDTSQTYLVLSKDDGSFSGRTADRSQQVFGHLRENAFTLSAAYTSGYRYSIQGTLNPRTGHVAGRGSDSDDKSLTFTIRKAAHCDGITVEDADAEPGDSSAAASGAPSRDR